MESNFNCVLVQDSRLLCTDQVNYAVIKGAANNTQAIFNANSVSSSQIVFNVQIPSEQTIIDRRVLLTSTVSVIITVPGVTEGNCILNLGQSDGMQCFPLHSLFSVISATINNTTVTTNIADILPAIMLMNEPEELYKNHGYTPCIPDNYYCSFNPTNANFTEGYQQNVILNNNVLGAYNTNSLNTDFASRGSHNYTITKIVNTTTNTTYNAATDNYTLYLQNAPADGSYQVYLSTTLTEPVLLSPFLFGDAKAAPMGFYGIQNLNLQMNISSPNRFWSSANPNLTVALNSATPFQNTRLIFTFLSPQPSMLLKSRNVVPYYSMPRYISTAGGSTSLPNCPVATWSPTTISSYPVQGITPSFQTLVSSTIQLNMIPDKLIIFTRPQLSTMTPAYSNSFLVINQININFANSSGLMSNYSQYDLWKCSVKNGSTQPWSDFVGWQTIMSSEGYIFPTPTCGSLLILEFGSDIELPDYLSPGSLGSFQIQFSLQVANQTTTYTQAASNEIPANTTIGFPSGATGITPELVLITMNSGVFVCDRGTSSVYEGLLSKQDVLDASMQPPYTSHDVQRLVGGSIHDKLKSAIGHVMHKKGHHHAHRHHKHHEEIGGSLGASTSGGSMHHHHHTSKIHKHIK